MGTISTKDAIFNIDFASMETMNMAEAMTDYEGDIYEAICYLADAWTSIYSDDLDEYAQGHTYDLPQSVMGCLALSSYDYFDANPAASWLDYTRHVAGVAWQVAHERMIYDDLEHVLQTVAVAHVGKEHRDELDPERLKVLEALDNRSFETLEEVREAASKAYEAAA